MRSAVSSLVLVDGTTLAVESFCGSANQIEVDDSLLAGSSLVAASVVPTTTISNGTIDWTVARGVPLTVIWRRGDGSVYDLTLAWNTSSDGACVIAGSVAS